MKHPLTKGHNRICLNNGCSSGQDITKLIDYMHISLFIKHIN